MDNIFKNQNYKLKKMSSHDAASWIISTFPIDSLEYWRAIFLIGHRSWKKLDQIRLAEYYFQKIPFASSKPYMVFISFMSITNFLKSIHKNIPSNTEDCNLLKYHLDQF